MSPLAPRRPSPPATAQFAAAMPLMTGTARPVTRGAVARGAVTRGQEGQIVTSLIVTFVLLVVAVASVRISGSAAVGRSMDAVRETLTDVHVRQGNFRLINQRFASWRELEARGLTLPGAQAVVASNETPSHWFVAIRDRSTGVICEKTGELFDAGPDERKATCREPLP